LNIPILPWEKRRKYSYCWRTRLKAEENMEVLVYAQFMFIEVQVWGNQR